MLWITIYTETTIGPTKIQYLKVLSVGPYASYPEDGHSIKVVFCNTCL
jgi:hypothetical protein